MYELATKRLYETEDGHKVQVVSAREGSIVCFPSQVGCAVQCRLCTARQFVRSLTALEMTELCMSAPAAQLYSCMGEGEPLHNIDSVVATLNSLPGRTAISTTVPSILLLKQFCDRTVDSTKIQLSVHEMELPHLEKSLQCLPSLRSVDLNFVFYKPYNIERLAYLASKYNRPVKLSRCNNTEFPLLSSRRRVLAALETYGAKVEIYNHDGADIGASCGQFN